MIRKTYLIIEHFRNDKIFAGNFSKQAIVHFESEHPFGAAEVMEQFLERRPTFEVISKFAYQEVATLVLKETGEGDAEMKGTIDAVTIYYCPDGGNQI